MAILVVIALYFVLTALAMQAVETLIAYGLEISREPSPLIGLLQAWCSLAAIWWVRSRWTSHVKTLHAVLGCLAIWGLLLLNGERTDFSTVKGAGWLASLATQFAVTSGGLMLIAVYRNRSIRPAIRRFSIMYLVIWTFVVAVLLGTGRWLLETAGWTWDVLNYSFFPHLIVVGVLGGLQAVSLWAVIQTPWSRRRQAIALALVTLTTILVALAVLFIGFREAGAELLEVCRQFGLQAMFLIATLLPLRIAADYGCSENSATTG